MQTKQEILKRAYEAHFSSQKYEKSNFGHTYKAVSESAMDEWAAKMASDFGVWIGRNHYKHDAYGWYWFGKKGLIVVREDIAQTTDELYKLFLKSIQQP